MEPLNGTAAFFQRRLATFGPAFGKEIRASRTQAGFTEAQMVMMLSSLGIQMTETEVAELEAGNRATIELPVLAAMLFLFEISIDDIILRGFQRPEHDGSSASSALR